MIRHNITNRIVFITSHPRSSCPVAAFTFRLMESMIPASYGTCEPILIIVQPELSRAYPDDADFVIRRDFRSDYMEAADFINANLPGVVIAQHHFALFGQVGNSCIGDLLKKVRVPVVTMLHQIPENPAPGQFRDLIDVCDASAQLLVMNRSDCNVLGSCYAVSRLKITPIIHSESDNPFDRERIWFHVGRQVWALVSDYLQGSVQDPRFFQEAMERSLMCGQ